MNGSRLQATERNRFKKLWESFSLSEILSFEQVYNRDADRHNGYKTGPKGALHTPSEAAYKTNKRLRRFIKDLCNVKEDRVRYVVPCASGFPYKVRSCSINVETYRNMNPGGSFRPVFGFIVNMNHDGTSLEALGHVWLHDVNTGTWIDPTPLEDNELSDGRRMVVQSSTYLTPKEREKVLQHPSEYHLPSLKTNTRVLAGCVFTDPALFGTGAVYPDYTASTLRLLRQPVSDLPLDFEPVNASALRKLKKDREFWSWRQKVLGDAGVLLDV